MDRDKLNYMFKKGFFIIPAMIIILIVLAQSCDVSADTVTNFSGRNSEFLPWHSSLWCLEILPFLVVVYSIMLIVKQREHIKDYRLKFPPEETKGLKQYIKFILRLPKRYFIPQLAYFMLFFWGVGWGLYIWALWSDYANNPNVAEILGYAAMAALDLFLLDINGNVLDSIGHTVTDTNISVLKGAIVITAICCAFCSFFLIIKLFVRSMLSSLHASKINVNHTNNHLYIFFGITDNSLTLAESIKDKDSKALIVHIEHAAHDDEETDGVRNILDQIVAKSSRAADINLDDRTIYLTANSEVPQHLNDENIWISLGLEKANSLIEDLKNYGKSQVHIFFLSDDRDSNVLSAKKMAEIMLDNQSLATIEKHIYCRTRKDSVTAVIEDKYSVSGSKLTVKVVDESTLSIDYLRLNTRFHPINFVDIDTSYNYGTVSSPFTSLIVGFGETGRDALRFLYEFGAFVDSKSPRDYSDPTSLTQRSQFDCYIFDKELDTLGAKFSANSPAISTDTTDTPGSNALVHFRAADHSSDVFYKTLGNIAPTLNYVVIALGDDEENIALAVNILKYIRKYRPDLRNIKIFVRAYESGSFSHLESVARYYNNIISKDEKGENDIINIFGQSKDLYSYDMIVKNEHRQKGEIFHEEYKNIAGGKSWKELEARVSSGDIDTIFDARRKMNQSMSNSLHADTKWLILKRVLNFEPQRLKSFIDKLLKDKGHVGHKKQITYPNGKNDFADIDLLMRNLAKLEHIRWNAAHEIIGFEPNSVDEQNIRERLHNCLIEWEKLADLDVYDYLEFDFQVVNTTLRLKNKCEE